MAPQLALPQSDKARRAQAQRPGLAEGPPLSWCGGGGGDMPPKAPPAPPPPLPQPCSSLHCGTRDYIEHRLAYAPAARRGNVCLPHCCLQIATLSRLRSLHLTSSYAHADAAAAFQPLAALAGTLEQLQMEDDGQVPP